MQRHSYWHRLLRNLCLHGLFTWCLHSSVFLLRLDNVKHSHLFIKRRSCYSIDYFKHSKRFSRRLLASIRKLLIGLNKLIWIHVSWFLMTQLFPVAHWDLNLFWNCHPFFIDDDSYNLWYKKVELLKHIISLLISSR